MSSDLEAAFLAAKQRIETLSQRPGNLALLALYARYKQATEGDCRGERPGSFDFVNRAKFDTWQALNGMSQAEAMQAYIDQVDELVAAD